MYNKNTKSKRKQSKRIRIKEKKMEKETKMTHSMRMTLGTKERLSNVIDKYKDDNVAKSDQQEAALIRILDIAESESVKGLHPELEGSLSAIDETLNSLIKQINGIVAGQDQVIWQARKERDEAILKKDRVLESIKGKEEKLIEEQKKMQVDLASAHADRLKAIQKLEDAKAFLTSREENIKYVDQDNERLKNECDNLTIRLDKFEKENENLQIEINRLKNELMSAELEKEKAVIAKERELRDVYNEKLRAADRENAKLQAKIEQFET